MSASFKERSADMKKVVRIKALGDWGEEKALSLLKGAGFHAVRDLNFGKANHPFADFYAERGSQRFIIGVKTRNRLTAAGKLNAAYNVRKKGKDLSGLAAAYNAVPAWIAIQVDVEKMTCSAFFGPLAQLTVRSERYSIPMTPQATAHYECLVRDDHDLTIRPEWTNLTRQ
jgi:Holliday junction resolvase